MVLKRIAVAAGIFLFGSLASAQGIGPSGPAAPAMAAPAVAAPAGPLQAAPVAEVASPAGQRQAAPAAESGEADIAETPMPDNGEAESDDASRIPNSFANFIEQSLGRPLSVYGRALFRRAPSTFAPIEAAAVTPDYVIGVGDQIVVRVWGAADFELPLTVQRDGTIALPRAGEVRVAGVPYRDLNNQIKAALSRVFRNFDLTVSLGRLTPITVYVVGEARRPGRFHLSPQSSLINAIFAVGGPSAHGSLRSVKVRRGDAVAADIDVYQFIAKGDRSADIRLLAGDMIVFEKLGPQVAIAGSVNRPAIYELKSPVLSVGEALELAGGLTNTATDSFASLERIEARKTRSVAQLSLQGDNLNVPLRDGDLLQVFPIGPKFENAITVRGNVAMPMRHPWRAGARVSDVIPDKEALISGAYWQTQNRLLFVDPKSGEQAKNEIKRHLPEINWSYAVIERIGEDLRPRLIPFNLEKAILGKDPRENHELQPGDTITVFSKNDIPVPLEERTVYVTLSGEFKTPGVYQLLPGESLQRTIERAGGVTQRAYILGTQLQRESIRREQRRRIDEIVGKIEQDLRAASVELASETAGPEGRAFLQSQIAFQRKALQAFRSAAVTGRLYLGLPRSTALTVTDLPDIQLEDGDVVHLPPRDNVVNVFGSVAFQNSQIYNGAKSVDDYIEVAGGANRRAETEDVMVLSIDGAALKRNRRWYAPWSWGRDPEVMPGDSLFVPEKIDHVPLLAQLKDWTQVMYQMGLGAAAIKTLRD